ncbi:protein containing Restriction endonuclease, type I, EcoRI, R subunit/Type III, Res subunit, partial [mine drainage metagenome]
MMLRPLLTFHESVVEEAALGYFRELGYETKFGPDIAPDGNAKERENWNDVILEGRLKTAIDRLNSHLSADARADAVRKVLRSESSSLVQSNRRFHDFLANGIDIETRRKEGRIAGDKAWLVDFEHPENNDWLVVNQFAV